MCAVLARGYRSKLPGPAAAVPCALQAPHPLLLLQPVMPNPQLSPLSAVEALATYNFTEQAYQAAGASAALRVVAGPATPAQIVSTLAAWVQDLDRRRY